MGLDNLEKFLKKNAEREEQEQIDWEKEKQTWLSEIDKFYEKIQGWLSDYEEKGLLKLELVKYTMREEYLGQYETKKMYIVISGQKVEIEPVGRIIIGAQGRIDMIGKYGKVKFVLVGENSKGPIIKVKISSNPDFDKQDETSPKEVKLDWKIATLAPNIQFLTLNADSFSDALLEVING
ncbi:MAG: hypothetical protein KAX49_01390 [Halanaerobiales bacterium]|nr:hypothetical protein [Halanaerobiales bacterium]